MLEAYRQHVAERAALGIPALPLSATQTAALIELIKAPPKGEEAFLLDLLTHRVPPGVDVLGVTPGVIDVEPLPVAESSDTNWMLVGSTSASSRSSIVCPGATAMLTV